MVRDGKGRFSKGHSGNPGGKRKAEFNLQDIIDECFTADDWKAAFIAMRPRLLRGDMKVMEFIADRRWGKPTQPVGGDKTNPLEVIFRTVNMDE
jgi:hypothetical protein